MLREIGRRTIRGKGIIDLARLFSITEGGVDKWTRVEIWMVTRKRPIAASLSLLWKPAQSLYSRVTIATSPLLGQVNPTILADALHRYDIERVYQWENDTFVLVSLLACSTQKVLESIRNLGIALGASPVALVGLPLPPRQKCPASLVRVSCHADSIVDVIVFAENAFAQFSPQDALCGQFVPDASSDESPGALNPANSLDNTPQNQLDDPLPSPPYNPTTSDDGETTPNSSPPVASNARGRLVYSGMVETCQDTEPRPISGNSPNVYIAPLTVTTYVAGTCGNGKTFRNIRVVDGNGTVFDFELTGLTVVPSFTISYFTV